MTQSSWPTDTYGRNSFDHFLRRASPEACAYASALVPGEGVEPTCLERATDFESVASANSAIRALRDGRAKLGGVRLV